MSSCINERNNCRCLHCGSKKLTVLFEDYTGYVTETSHCAKCGYYLLVDAGRGDWEQATWSSNMKDGVLVFILASEDESGIAASCLPATRAGAVAHACSRTVTGADEFIAAYFVTDSTFELLSGDYPDDDASEFTGYLQRARAFLANIQLKTEFPVRDCAH